ncbi:Vesicle-mediated ER to Golgi transport protein [Friedmanniomyces endolithicus]|nr:Vesicle-mediated ER to Golgi transport protein [Friedmanniomyces endolithicus]
MLKTPPLQTASATIDTLCARLHSATLREDRRAAILGLRSFAKQYLASVASGSLRELLTTLRRDGLGEAGSTTDSLGRDGRRGSAAEGGDVDTIRLVLETLLMLFNPDSSSPEASDEIAYFMADGFSMRQDNVTLLLSLLDPASPFADYYSRLYSLQLLSAICAARPERLQECILGAPLGVSRLVAVLDDTRDAVRNAGLLLLVDLTSGANEELRKIVAFEDVFTKVFSLIRVEGGLAEAGITAQDCLSLLANLIKGSPSNQTMFRESGCVLQMTQMLEYAFPPSTPEAAFLAQAREKAAWGLLRLLQLFLEPGETNTAQNQAGFFRAGTAQVLIDLAFVAELPPPIRTLALKCTAALIASNAPLQEAFAALTIEAASFAPPELKVATQTNGSRSGHSSAKGSARASVERPRLYIIEALLDLTLAKAQADSPLRAAACSLIQAYLCNHDRIKAHFLARAIGGHADHEVAANVLNTLLHPDAGDAASVMYASWIVSDLVDDQLEAKAALAAVMEGNESEGEDVLTFIQALGSQLQAALQPADERLVAAYAGLLAVLLWDFADGVNSLLAEGSGLLQALVAAVSPASGDSLVVGLSAVLLGTIYEFSTKDSPIPRRTLAPLLAQRLGRSKYLDALSQLHRQPAIRDFDLIEPADEALLSRNFTDIFMLEFSRLRKAIDKDPGVEVLPFSVAEDGVDRDVLDELRQQVQTAKEALAVALEEKMKEQQVREQEVMAREKEVQTAGAEVERLRRINGAMQVGHEGELEGLGRRHEEAIGRYQSEHQRALEASKVEGERKIEERLREQGVAATQKVQEAERKAVEIGNTHRDEQSRHADTARQLEALTAQHTELGTREIEVRRQFEDLTLRHEKISREHGVLRTQAAQAGHELEHVRAESEARRENVIKLEAEMQELREELAGREAELATERAGFGDLEKELEGAKASLAAAAAAATRAQSKTPTGSTAAGDADVQRELVEAKEAERVAKEELEGMLLLMGDLEAKKDAYREKVKELGGSVSEDEDEEDEDEDGEEEEADEEGVD